MKKRLALIFSFVLIICFTMSGCSGSGSSGGTASDATYDITEYVKNVNYKEMPYFIQEAEVTDEEVEEQIDMMLQYATETENVTEGVVEDGDTINVAYSGTIDGEAFEGGSSESYDITVGTTSMIDGFVEGLVGQNIGDTVTLNLRFPDDYHAEDLQGKDVVFEVTINSKRISVTPELTDELAKEYYDVETVDELRETIRDNILESKKQQYESTVKSQLWNILEEEAEIESFPEEEIAIAQTQVDAIKEDYAAQAETYGVELEEFLTTFMGMDEESLDETLNEYRDEMIRDNMIVKYIASQENITLSEKEYKEKIAELLESSGMTDDIFESYYGMPIEEYADANGFREGFLQQMVMDRIIELGKEVSQEEYESYIDEKLGSEDLEIELEDEDESSEVDEEDESTEG